MGLAVRTQEKKKKLYPTNPCCLGCRFFSLDSPANQPASDALQHGYVSLHCIRTSRKERTGQWYRFTIVSASTKRERESSEAGPPLAGRERSAHLHLTAPDPHTEHTCQTLINDRKRKCKSVDFLIFIGLLVRQKGRHQVTRNHAYAVVIIGNKKDLQVRVEPAVKTDTYTRR